MPERVVVAGGGLAGLRTAEGLRTAGFTGSVVLVADESGLPYDRPPLSKQALRLGAGPEEIALTTSDALQAAGIDYRSGSPVLGVDGDRVRTAAGDIAYDILVVATGSRARLLPGVPHSQDGPIHHLRTDADSVRLRTRMGGGRALLTVGGGFIGAEVASAALDAGSDVTMVEAAEAPCLRAVGPTVAAALAERYRAHGVTLHTGVGVTGVEIAPTVSEPVLVELSDGTRAVADDILVGVGTVPCSGWLPGHGDAGVRCDEQGRALDVPNELRDRVYAVGDVSRWPTPWGEHRAVEHWTTAVDHARAVAAAIMGLSHPPSRPPYFWSDQFGMKLQLTGWPHRAVTAQPWADARGRHVSLYTDAADRVVAVLAVDAPAALARARQRLMNFPAAGDLARELDLTAALAVQLTTS